MLTPAGAVVHPGATPYVMHSGGTPPVLVMPAAPAAPQQPARNGFMMATPPAQDAPADGSKAPRGKEAQPWGVFNFNK